MNHIYKSIWSASLGTWVAVSELAKGKSKSSAVNIDPYLTTDKTNSTTKHWQSYLVATGLLAVSTNSFALPTGNELVAGQATVSTPVANQMQIQQTSDRAAINWQSFSVAQHESVNIQQPNTNSALLNRVVGQDASQIQGKLQANGQVYLVNPNGVIFSKSAQVDVGGLVATTHEISNRDFMAGKNHFTQNGATGKVENHGTINSKEGGVVALIGEKVTNTGSINTPKGTTALAAGKTVDLDFQGDGLVEVKVSEAALNAQINNHGVITADGGRVVMSTKAANALVDTVINQDGIVKARGLTERNGEIILEGGVVSQTGTLDVSGQTGGKVTINARSILDAGTTNADGTAGKGGDIKMTASHAIIQTAAANTHANGKTQGGSIQLDSQNSTFTSGKLSATGDTGGTINVLSNNRVVLAGAEIDASGNTQGGAIRVGGDFHGTNPNIKNAKTTQINSASKIKANGGKGKVVVWSDQKTDYYGSISANKQGEIEVSSKGDLTYGGMADAGSGGSLLLDPKNIVITSTGSVASYGLIDPNPATGNWFGDKTVLLGTTSGNVFTGNGNVVVTSPYDDFAATDAGAVYLFNITTGQLLATLTGNQANDQVGYGSVTALNNGNYVVGSYLWNNGTGAVTWGNGLTGVSGIVSNANSLVGSAITDQVGSGGVTALSNGNYVVRSDLWNNGAGAVTWGNGSTGTTGVVSNVNSLVGAVAGDSVGSNGITLLSNGNYVVSSSAWNNNAGAVTWGNGLTGVSGVVSNANSLVGSTAFDQVGNNAITVLSNGNYVINSSSWDNGALVDAGAVTWGNGLTGVTGIITNANSLVGTTAFDQLGSGGVTALNNGNYVINSLYWDNGALVDAGAVTWGNGTTGISGFITNGNSLVGSAANDQVGSNGITALSNGNYVVDSAYWNNGALVDAGAATWGNGLTGVSGIITNANSLVGGTAFSLIGYNGITALNNGNYVVSSQFWNNGAIVDAGAVTWGNGTTGISGIVTNANSLVGNKTADSVGIGGITALSNGNYVVNSYLWDNGAAIDAGAVTWGNGTTGTTGIVSSNNSLVGSTTNDNVGTGITALSNGNYVVTSVTWNNGTATQAGAVTWGNGLAGVSGVISSSNSLVGSNINDQVGSNGITVLSNGNYVVESPYWNNGTATQAGAATWGNGLTGISGIVSSSNSLVGSSTDDQVSSQGITTLSNGNYVVASAYWNNGTATQAGAVTWGNGTIGVSGVVSSSNSLIGSTIGDQVGIDGVIPLSNGNYLVRSRNWDNGALIDAGQVRVATPQNINFDNGIGQTMSFNPSLISQTLALGTNVTLQANNDITLDVGTDINVTGTTGGKFTLQAGRNITLNSNISTANGDFLAIAGDPNAIATDRDIGAATVTLGNGATINAGTGKATLVANGGNFVNNSGSATPITAGQWWVYSTDPTLDSKNGMTANKHYGQTYTGAVPSYATSGNWFLYSITPQLSVAPNTQTVIYGNVLGFTPTYTGFIDGDTAATAGITGTALFTGGTTSTSGNYIVGSHDLNYVSGLSSSLGYSFTNNAASINELTVTQRDLPITGLTGNNKVYDGTTAATLSGTPTISPITNDIVTLGGAVTADFVDPNVGTNKPITLTGAYNITGVDATNYNLLQPTGLTANITTANLSIQANNANKTYDGLAYSGGNGVSYGGFVNGENANVLTGTLGYTGNSQGATNVGNYTITPTGLTSNNYAITYLNGTLAINTAPLTIQANNANKTYDGLAYSGGNGVNYNGFVNGENANVLTGTLGYTGNSQGATNVGNYAITPTGLTSNNYAIAYLDGALTIDPAALTIQANNFSKSYDGIAYSGGNGVSYTGLVNGESGNVLTGTLSYTGNSQGAVNMGNYAITPTGLSSNNYTITYVDGTLAITPATVTIQANNFTKIYDGLAYNGGNGVTYTGFIVGDDPSVLTGTLSYTGNSQGATNTGSYTITPTGLTSNNYIVNYVDGVLSINPATLSVQANNFSKTYDGLVYTGGNGVSYTGFVNGETANVLAGTVSYTGNSQGAKDVGSYSITPTGLTSKNYAINYLSGGLSINPALLTITANDASKTFGQTLNFNGTEFTSQGLVNGETIGRVTLNSSGSTANASVLGSPYSIIASNATDGTFKPTNYDISYLNGRLTVQALPTTPTNPVIPNSPVIINNVINFVTLINPVMVPVTRVSIAVSISFDTETQRVPLQTSVTGRYRAHELRWFYKYWLTDMFVRTRYNWLFDDLDEHIQALFTNSKVRIVNRGMKLPK